jgi:hypothetical protein
MAHRDTYDVRAAMVELLISKLEQETYPSATTMNMLEELLTPKDVPRYAEFLMNRIANDQYPSIPMMARLKKLA